MSETIEECYHKLISKIDSSAMLVAVTKRQPISKIKQVYACGQKDFAENIVQEALTKIEELKNFNITWHFIGAIQSNKTKQIAENFDWVQSVASIKHAKRLNDQRPKHMKPLNVCIQVNISQEENKSGVYPKEIVILANEILRMKRLKLRGIMAIPAKEAHVAKQREVFAELKKIFDEMNAQAYECDTLSMGMSGEYQVAIEEGSTMVRVGTALFGGRV